MGVRPRVAIVGAYPQEDQPVRGGVEGVLSALVPALVRTLGDGVTVVSPGPAHSDSGRRSGEPRILRIPKSPGLSGYYQARQCYSRLEIGREHDIVHIQDATAMAPAALGWGLPVIYTEHGRPSVEAKYQRGRIRLQQRFLVQPRVRTLAQRCDTAVAISGYQEQWLSQGLGARKVQHIPNPIAECYLPAASPGHPEAGTLLYVGGVMPRKGLLDLIRALAILGARDHAAHLYIAGGFAPADSYVQTVRKEAETLGVDGLVEWLGELGNDDLVAEYTRCSLCVIPSFHETFGLGAAQALGMGRPAVVYDIPGVRDVVLDGETGIRVPLPEGPQGLANAIGRLLSDPALAADMGARGHEHARTHFHPDVVAAQTVALYEEVLARH